MKLLMNRVFKHARLNAILNSRQVPYLSDLEVPTMHTLVFPVTPHTDPDIYPIHPLYLHSAMSDMSLPTSRCGRRASAPTSQES
jgi:hypothetical protein